MHNPTVVIHQPGGPEALLLEDRPVDEPGPGQIRIRHHAIGVNFIDCYHRSGLYPLALPHALGMEGAGVVEAVGEGVTHLQAGDRVGIAVAHLGGDVVGRGVAQHRRARPHGRERVDHGRHLVIVD